MNDNNKLTWDELKKHLELINCAELERLAGLRKRRLADCKAKSASGKAKSTLTESELETIQSILNTLPR